MNYKALQVKNIHWSGVHCEIPLSLYITGQALLSCQIPPSSGINGSMQDALYSVLLIMLKNPC